MDARKEGDMKLVIDAVGDRDHRAGIDLNFRPPVVALRSILRKRKGA